MMVIACILLACILVVLIIGSQKFVGLALVLLRWAFYAVIFAFAAALLIWLGSIAVREAREAGIDGFQWLWSLPFILFLLSKLLPPSPKGAVGDFLDREKKRLGVTGPIWAFTLGVRLRRLIGGKRLRAAEKELETAHEEVQQMEQFVSDPERVKRWKAAQMKCQFFANAYLDDKNSPDAERASKADAMLERVIQKVLAEADASTNDEYCRSAILHSLVECMCKVGQFERANKLIDSITVDTIRKNAVSDMEEEKDKQQNSVAMPIATTIPEQENNGKRAPEKSDKNGDTGKPNILIKLPVYLLMTAGEPFADMAVDHNDAKLDLLSVYTALYKVYCYNKLLLPKFENDIYYATILDKQRELIAANSLDTAEQFFLLMRMFCELEALSTKKYNDEDPGADLENIIAIGLIKKEKEFADVKDDEIARVDWTVKIATVLKQDRSTIEKHYFPQYWNNSGFTKSELETWLTKSK